MLSLDKKNTMCQDLITRFFLFWKPTREKSQEKKKKEPS